MNIDAQASYLSSLEALQRAVVEREAYPSFIAPGSLMERARTALDARIARLWAEFKESAREFPQAERRATA